MLLPQPFSFHAFALLPGGGYTPLSSKIREQRLGSRKQSDVESRDGWEAAVRLLLIAALLGVFFVGFPASTSPISPPEQADISRSGRDFLEVCSGVGSAGGADGEGNRDAARTARDATCLGWVAGFTEGFLVHDELVGVPRRDRLACVPNGESAMQIVRVMKRYLERNPGKAHRATRYIASLALAGAFPCRGGK